MSFSFNEREQQTFNNIKYHLAEIAYYREQCPHRVVVEKALFSTVEKTCSVCGAGLR
mgnify:CR=1 FL=1